MAFYRRIRDLREDNDKTQKEIAQYLGTPYQYYAVCEKGGSEISFERAIMLAEYYNVSLDCIAGLTDKKRSYGAPGLTSEQQELIAMPGGLSPKNGKKFRTLLKQLIAALK